MSHTTTIDRNLALEIFKAGVKAVHPDSLMPLLWPHLVEGAIVSPILVLGGGKAGAAMATALLNSAPAWARFRGIINVPNEQVPLHNDESAVSLHGSRPSGGNLPTKAGVTGSMRQMELAASAPPGTVGICLLSGGASALMPLPAYPVTLADKLTTTRLLQQAGADITIMNSVRKHLSAIKGGGLARAWLESPSGQSGCPLHTFAISDVVSDDSSVIASGPTVADPSTFKSTWDQLNVLGVAKDLPPSVVERFRKGIEGTIPETPKKLPDQIRYHLLGNNRKALEAASRQAIESDCAVYIFQELLEGPIEIAAQRIADEILQSKPLKNKPLVLLWGGEPTVVVPPGSGMGGRNQELALRLATLLPGEWMRRTTLLCAGTDGEDGPTDAAGGFFDSFAMDRANKIGLNINQAIASHSSHNAHLDLGTLLRTGWTGTNVADIVVTIVRA